MAPLGHHLALMEHEDEVKVVAQGPGYAVSSAGQALTAGSAGQTVRVRMENGRIVSGTVNDSGTVDVTL